MRKAALLCALLLPALASGQVSGYVSATHGSNSNPLYNYEMIADRPTEGYWELTYTDEDDLRTVEIGYVGGVMLFRDLAPRNYLEHRAVVKYRAGGLLLSGLLGARHDRPEFKEFNNYGAEAGIAYTWGEENEPRLELSDRLGLRTYEYLKELNNITNEATLSVTTGNRTVLLFRAFAAVGIKHFTTSTIDSSAFSEVSGSGNPGGGNGGGSGNSKKQSQLVAEASANTFQITGGIALAKEWTGGGIEGEARYRIDPGTDTRLINQIANSTIIGEDIYNDHFSYAGPELAFTLRHTLPLDLRFSVTGEAQQKNYLVPAYDLMGVETYPDRVDRRGSLQTSLARSFPVGESVSVDLTLSVLALRNESNDTYNDFSVRSFGVSLGIGW